MRAMILLVVVCAIGAKAGTAWAATDRHCGPVAPKLKPGMMEEFAFSKVVAENVSCHRAKRVALDFAIGVNGKHGFHSRRVDGFECSVHAPSVTWPAMLCTRAHATILGYNDGA